MFLSRHSAKTSSVRSIVYHNIMDTIIVKIKCKPKYRLLGEMRNQGLLFDAIRQALDTDDDGVQEITDEEYESIENLATQKVLYDKS